MKILQRYIFFEFMKFFLILVFAFFLIFIVGNFIEKIDIIKNFVLIKIFRFYAFSFFEIFNQLIPFIIFFSILLSLGNLGRQNELIITEVSGIASGRLLIPFYVFIVLLSIFVQYNAVKLAPEYKFKAYRIYREELIGDMTWFSELGKKNLGIVTEREGKFYLFSELYRSRDRTLLNPVMIFLDDGLRVSKRIDSQKGLYLGNGKWRFFNNSEKLFEKSGKVQNHALSEQIELDLAIDPSLFNTFRIKPDTFTSKELKVMIDRLYDIGQYPLKYLVEYYFRTSQGVFIILISLFAIPLGLRSRKDNIPFLLGIALLFITFYIGIFRVSYTLGINGAISPVFSAWLPNIFILCFFLYLKFKKILI